MELRPGYKQTDIGALPEGWDVVPIGELFSFKNGLNKAKQYFGYGTPIVNYMDVFDRPGLRIGNVVGRVDVLPRELAAYEVRKGDVFFTRTSETINEVGVASVMLDRPERTVFSGFVLRARPSDDSLDDTFKAYCFSPLYFRQQVTSRASYTTRALTNGRSLSAALLARPPLAEQRAIAQALSDVDAAIQGLSRLIAKKRGLKLATMQRLLTGQSRMPGFSAPWQVKRLGDHVTFLKNGVNSRAQLTSNDPIRYLHYGDIHVSLFVCLNPRINDMPRLPHNLAMRLSRLVDGDLVFVDASEDLDGIGKSVEIEGGNGLEIISGLHTIAARFDKTVLSDGFKRYLQFFPAFKVHLRRLSAGTKVYATNRAHIASVEMELPAIEEQSAIARVLSDIDAEIEAIEAQLGKTQVLKQGMMQALLTGRVRLPAATETAEEVVHA